jgi:hypothetical protein
MGAFCRGVHDVFLYRCDTDWFYPVHHTMGAIKDLVRGLYD